MILNPSNKEFLKFGIQSKDIKKKGVYIKTKNSSVSQYFDKKDCVHCS